ncbi:hypothetical protein J3F83DRAFT_328464 [Trichoderma novae-zelandiae]
MLGVIWLAFRIVGQGSTLSDRTLARIIEMQPTRSKSPLSSPGLSSSDQLCNTTFTTSIVLPLLLGRIGPCSFLNPGRDIHAQAQASQPD